jgi:hypothetical protein
VGGTREFDRVSMKFGQLVIAFRPRSDSLRFSVSESHWPFIVEGLEPTLELSCGVGPISPRRDKSDFSIDNVWDIWRASDGSEEMIFWRGSREVPSWRLRIEPSFRSGDVEQAPVPRYGPFRADDSPMLQYIVVRVLGRLGSLVVHAATAIVDNEALVFVGHSRAGKSTMARIAESLGARIPTDDRTILNLEGNRVFAWGSPWYGSLVRKTPEGAPVRSIYLLHQSAENRIETLPPGRAIKELFVRLVQPRLSRAELESSLATLEELVARVNVSVLHFRPTADAFLLACGAAAPTTG